MKILLIQPPSVPDWSRHIFAFEPLALEYIGAGLKLDGHTVQLLDSRFDSEVEAAFKQLQPEVVGFTAFTVHVPWVKSMAERLKTIAPDVFIVVGGHHPTVKPGDFNSPAIEAVVLGEGGVHDAGAGRAATIWPPARCDRRRIIGRSSSCGT